MGKRFQVLTTKVLTRRVFEARRQLHRRSTFIGTSVTGLLPQFRAPAAILKSDHWGILGPREITARTENWDERRSEVAPFMTPPKFSYAPRSTHPRRPRGRSWGGRAIGASGNDGGGGGEGKKEKARKEPLGTNPVQSSSAAALSARRWLGEK